MRTTKLTLPLYLGGAGLSLFGNAAIAIVLPWLVISRTGDPSAAAIVAAAAGIAAVPATLFSGRLTDRFGHRNVAVAADVGSALSVAAIAVVDATFGLSLSWFVALGVAGAIFDVPGMTARQALLADVSTTSGVQVDKVAGGFQTMFGVAFLAGPGIAGFLMTVLEPIDVVWLTAACSAAAALATLCMRLTDGVPASHDEEELLGGWATIRGSRALKSMLVLAFASSFVTPPLISVLLPGHFNATGHAGQLGLTLSAFAVGSLLGSVLYPAMAARSRRTAFVSGILAMTLGMSLFAALAGFWLVAAGTLAMGIGSGLFGPVWNVYVAEQVPARVRGQVLGLTNAIGLTAGPLGLGALSLLLMRWELVVGAVVMAAVWAVAAVYALVSRGMKELSADPVPAEAAPDAEPVPAEAP